MLNVFRALRTGFIDGWESPFEMNVGMSYDSDVRQAAWDRASIWGQRARRVVLVWDKSEGMA